MGRGLCPYNIASQIVFKNISYNFFSKIGKNHYSSPLLRSENSVFLMKCKIVEEVKLGPYETSDSSPLLERVIKISNIGKRIYGMCGVLELSASV